MVDDDATAVTLDAHARRDGGALVVDGRATVPEGALVSWEVVHALHPSFREEGTAEVAGGRFTITLDTGGWPPGELEVWLGFQTVPATGARQPDAVLARYGHQGERMVGDQVVDAGVLRRAECVIAA